MHKSRDAGGTRGSIKTEAGRSEITQENQADNLILSRKNYTNNLDECKRKHEVKLRGFPWLMKAWILLGSHGIVTHCHLAVEGRTTHTLSNNHLSLHPDECFHWEEWLLCSVETGKLWVSLSSMSVESLICPPKLQQSNKRWHWSKNQCCRLKCKNTNKCLSIQNLLWLIHHNTFSY